MVRKVSVSIPEELYQAAMDILDDGGGFSRIIQDGIVNLLEAENYTVEKIPEQWVVVNNNPVPQGARAE